MAKVVQNLSHLMRFYGKQPCMPALINRQKNISFFRQSKVVENSFIITRATPDENTDILDLMWDSYYVEEPVTAALQLGRDRNCIFDDLAMKILCKGMSIVARCKYDGCIVGAALNDVTCPWDPDEMEKFACSLDNEQMTQLFMFWAHAQRVPKLWDTYCQQQIFEIVHMFVRKHDRKKGLARKLMNASIDLASDAGYRVIRVDASNTHTAAICERMKMHLANEIPYCSYVGADNMPILKVEEPNKSLKTYVLTPHALTTK